MGDRYTERLLEIQQRHIIQKYVPGLQAGLLRNNQKPSLAAIAGGEDVAAGNQPGDGDLLPKEFVPHTDGAQLCPKPLVQLFNEAGKRRVKELAGHNRAV